MPVRCRWLPSHASDRCRSWSVTPRIRLAVTLAYSAQHNGGGGRAVKPAPLPPPPTLLLGATPLATPLHSGPPGPGQRGQACPPDRDDSAPGRIRLCPASSGVDHRPCSRPPRLSMTGTVRGGGDGGAMLGGREGCRGGGRAGVGRCCEAPPPHPCCSAAILAEGA